MQDIDFLVKGSSFLGRLRTLRKSRLFLGWFRSCLSTNESSHKYGAECVEAICILEVWSPSVAICARALPSVPGWLVRAYSLEWLDQTTGNDRRHGLSMMDTLEAGRVSKPCLFYVVFLLRSHMLSITHDVFRRLRGWEASGIAMPWLSSLRTVL